MPRFEIYAVLALFCLAIGIGFIDNNNPLAAAALSLIGLLLAVLSRNELENARWDIPVWNKIFPVGGAVFIFLVFVYFVVKNFAALSGSFSLPTAISTSIFIFNAGIGLFMVHALVFSKPVNR